MASASGAVGGADTSARPTISTRHFLAGNMYLEGQVSVEQHLHGFVTGTRHYACVRAKHLTFAEAGLLAITRSSTTTPASEYISLVILQNKQGSSTHCL